jgi:hypothetical protein
MKKILFPAIGLLASLLTAQAQYFTPGNLAVLRIGGASQYDLTSGGGAAVWIDQYTTNGTLVSSFAVPSSGSNALILSGEPYEGYLTLTPNSSKLVFAGYNTAAPYSSELIDSASTNVPRVIATLDGYGNFDEPITNMAIFNTYTITSAVSDGTNYWAGGTGPKYGPSVVYVGTADAGADNAVLTGLFYTGFRSVNLYNNALYATGYESNSLSGTEYGAGSSMLLDNAGALPTNSTSYTNIFPTGTSAASTPSDLVIDPTGSIAYVADYSFGIVKFTNSGSGWVSNYTIVLTNAGYASASGSQHAISVTADFTQNPVVLYATTGETYTNRLVTLQDTGTAAGANATVVNLALGSASGTGTNTYRGVRFVPGAYPVITSQPASVTNDAGQTISFSISATGSPTLTYQWYSNSVANPTFVAIPSATLSTFNLVDTDTNESGSQFYAIVSNAYGIAQSSNATATINPPGPPINIQVTPSSQTVNAGSSAVFTATFVGATNSVSYAWSLNGIPLTDGPLGGSTISGSTNAILTITDAFATNDGSYEVIISNSIAIASGGPGVLLVNDPAIITNVTGGTNIPGSGPVDLTVSAIGTGLTYQWLSNGVAISGANSSSYSAPGSATISASSYSVVVTSSSGVSVTNGPTIVSFTPLILDETFTYPDGNLFDVAAPTWTEISGTSPILVLDDRVQIAQTNTTKGTAFAQSLYTQPQSNTVIWASFTVNLTTLPSDTTGTYFAYFEDTNFGFYARIFAFTTNKQTFTPDIPSAAYPGTYRLGVSDKSGSVSAVVELDMAPGIDYHVVAFYDMVNELCGMAVNPSQTEYNQVYSPTAPSPLVSGYATDAFTFAGLPMAGYGLREASGCGILELDDLEVSYDWNTNNGATPPGAGSGYAAVTANLTAELPVIGLLTPGITNYAGNPGLLEVAASGIDLTYAWFQNGTALSDGTNISGSATPTLAINLLDGTNSGDYTVVVSNEAGSVTSAVAVVSVNTTPTTPIFTLEPSNIVTSLGSTVTFTSAAVGTGPLTYQWSTGASGANLTLAGVSTNISGSTYSVVVTGGTGLSATSAVVTLTVNGPVITNIAYLRSLQDASLAPTITVPASNSVTVYQVTGVVIESTNLESATYAEYWIQDSTAGIEFFVEDPTFRPHLGDVVSVSGVVDIFDDALELDGSANNPQEPYFIVSTNGESSPLPFAPELIPFGFSTANPALSSLVYQGSLATFTNVYFVQAGATFGDEGTYEVTNNSGQSYSIYTGESDGPDIIGQTIPKFAYSITGPYDQFDTTYEIMVTAASDIVTAPPPVVTNATATLSGANLVLAWTAVPASYTYSIWSATNLAGPWVSVQGGLWFTNSSATYTNTNVFSTNAPAMFFQIDSP